MNELKSFPPWDQKYLCRACLRTSENVVPMTICEKKTYQNILETKKHQTSANESPKMEYEMKICTICKWILNKFIKFAVQCQRADEMLGAAVKKEINAFVLLQLTSSHNISQTKPEIHCIDPNGDHNLKNDDKHEMMMVFEDDHHGDGDDDDEIPLVMLKQDDCFNEKTDLDNNSVSKHDPEFWQESVKMENYHKKSRQKKKELREGFSSRMVQETNEYVVIKLTKAQVLEEMSERAKSEVYLRAPFKCKACVKGFNFDDVLQTHLKRHSMEHGSFKCEMCTQCCPTAVSLRGHIKSHTTRYKCKICGQVRLSRQHLLEHHAIKHTLAPTDYTCDKCNFKTNKRTVIQRHVRSHAAGERLACHRCGKLFKTVESLRIHTARHDNSSRVRCGKCDKRFIYPSLLHKHVAAVHEREDYYCVECDVKFKSAETLRLHFKKAKKHRDSSSYKHECRQCSQRFVCASSLCAHESRAHGAARRHACACGRRYGSRAALRAHRWRAHAHTEKDQTNAIDCHSAPTEV